MALAEVLEMGRRALLVLGALLVLAGRVQRGRVSRLRRFRSLLVLTVRDPRALQGWLGLLDLLLICCKHRDIINLDDGLNNG